ncbi:MAG: SagB/ThcOx family dehydrogenase [Candidatus Binatia bacterium]
MSNRDIEEAKRYHKATRHSPQSVRQNAHTLDWENRPSLYKVYPDLPLIPLPRDFPPPGADTLQAIASTECEQDNGLTVRELSRLLFFSAGLTKKKILPGGEDYHFRAAACAGALYPIEIYVVSTDIPGLEAGVYHFHPGEFALRRLRSGDCRPELAGAAGDNQTIAAAPVALVFSAIFWRSAWKYQARCYRYCFWDCGTILANLLAAAAAEPLPCSVEMSFVDSKVNHLLGLDGENEASLCLAPLGRSLEWATHAVGREVPSLEHRVEPLSAKDVAYAALRRMHAASSLSADEETRPWRGVAARQRSEAKELPTAPLEPSLEKSAPLGEVILKRGSTRHFEQNAIRFSQLSTILNSSARGIPADFLEGPETSLLDLYLIVNAVEGLEAGSYYFSSVEGGLRRLKTGSFRHEAGYLCLEQPLAADAGAVVFFLSDLDRVLARFGNRGYRAAQLEAGIIGGKLYLSAYSVGLGATGLTFYDDEVVEFFSPHAQGKDAIFVVALGKSRTSGASDLARPSIRRMIR